MTVSRSSGVLLHITSLPGPHGVGDLGAEAYRFVDFLARAGQTIWQVLPIGPTGWGNSPYQSPSAFAGNPLLIDLRQLQQDGLLGSDDLADAPDFPKGSINFDLVSTWRTTKLEKAFDRFNGRPGVPFRTRYNEFCHRCRNWLDDYALFMALKENSAVSQWTEWEPDLVRRKPHALAAARRKLGRSIRYHSFIQFLFFQQWSALHTYARERNVRIFGDVPIFVAHDSADVWAHQDLFKLDESGRPTVVAGVPPDYFSATGQRWGNPLYRWDVLARTSHAWWVERLRASFQLYDKLRIDHFRGFESYWEIPAHEETAVYGQWLPGPGVEFFRTVERQLGTLDLVAEDLGLITPAVEQLRDDVGLPGMRVLQFGFGEQSGEEHRPYSYPRHCVAYTGTHDNDTSAGWFHRQPGPGASETPDQVARERDLVRRFLGTDGREIHWEMIRAVHASVAELAIIPMQDLLGLGSEARMNTPGTNVNNWAWKLEPGQITREMEERLADLTEVYGRSPSKRQVQETAAEKVPSQSKSSAA